jgi:hypothetical protein
MRTASIAVGLATAVVLALTASSQIYDTNFYTLWEATALLAGDHPYRDFFEWGVPLQALASAAAQRLGGGRLLAEFVLQWSFITAGAVIAFRLGVALSRSLAASLAAAALALLTIAGTPTFHYPKLFFYPLAIALCWRYIDRPVPGRAAALGVLTGIAFLFRHDHGIYVGIAAVLACALARVSVPSSRHWRSAGADTAVYVLTAAAVIAPWAITVQRSEGLLEYVAARQPLYVMWSANESPYRSLLTINPLQMLRGDPPPPPRPGEISFEWGADVDDARRQRLEQEYRLTPLAPAGPDGRWHYRVDNLYDPALMVLARSFNRAEGMEWDRLEAAAAPRPARQDAIRWIQQVMLLAPLLLLGSAAVQAGSAIARRAPVPADNVRTTLAAGVLAIVDSRLFREPSYSLLVVPITAALCARWLVWRGSAAPLWSGVRAAVTSVFLVLTAIAAFGWSRTSPILEPASLPARTAAAFAELTVYPPIDGYAGADTARIDHAAWAGGDIDRARVIMRYLHDCTADGDRILITGSTPFQVGYYTQRRVAGGHLFWHFGWRSDAAREAGLLRLLLAQSVPFAMSTTDPVLADLAAYPNVRRHVMTHYRELEGSEGLVLIDTRRPPTGRFGSLGFPCFR